MRSCIFVAALALVSTGCGDNVVPVSGRVTLDKKPLANATVIFSPVSDQFNAGPGSRGKTDANGDFTLHLMSKEVPGAVIGKHKVSITAYEGDDGTVQSSGSDMAFRKRLVPAKYNAKTTLTFDVLPGGNKNANFDLASDADAEK